MSTALPPIPPATDREIVTTRVFDIPRERLFVAYANPEYLAKWWGPNGFTNTFEEFDMTPGGVWSFVMHGPNGINYPNRNVFVEVVKPERIVFQHVSAPRFQMTITLEDLDGKTRLTWRMLFETAEMCTNVQKIVVESNEQNFDRLTVVLAQMT